MNDMIEQLDDDHILVRIEKCGIKKTAYSLEKWHRSSVAMRLAKMQDRVSAHEVITGSHVRLYFDIDADNMSDLMQYIPTLDDIVKQQIGYLPLCRILKSSGDKNSLHVYYDVNVSIQFAKHIAEVAHKKIPNIDVAVYGHMKSLRMPNCIKIKENKIVDRRFCCSIDLV